MIIEVSSKAITILLGGRFAIDQQELAEALTHPIGYSLRGHGRLSRVNLHPDEWWIVRDAFRAISEVEAGTNRQAEVEAAYAMRAGKRIYGQLDRLSAHPAYHHRGIAGTSRVALPAHWLDTEHLFPSRRQALLDGAKRGIDSVQVHTGTLHPRIKRVRGKVFTVWELRSRKDVGAPGEKRIASHVD